MLGLRRHAAGITVGTVALPLLKHVLPHSVAGQFTVLVFGAADFRALHRLRVELDALDRQPSDVGDASDAPYPGHGRVHTAWQQWGQPTVRAAPVVEATGAVAGLAAAPVASVHAPLVQPLLDRHAAMLQLGCEHHAARLVHQRQAAHPGARVDLERQRLRAGPRLSFLEDDGEGVAAQHCCLPVAQESPCLRCTARADQGLRTP